MNQAITVELQFFLISILWGVLLLLVYDGLRIIRRLIKHDSFFVAVEDLIFWVLASLFIFAMMYKENNGIIRGFSVMGMAIGMVLYHYILSEFLVNFVTKFIKTLFRPFGIAFGWVKRFVLYLQSIGKKIVNFLIKRLKKTGKSVKITLDTRKKAADVKRLKRLEKKEAIKKEEQKKAEEIKVSRKNAMEKKAAEKNATVNNKWKQSDDRNKKQENKTKDKIVEKTKGNQTITTINRQVHK
jgi:spore cortex biosynthesis protein YabQ